MPKIKYETFPYCQKLNLKKIFDRNDVPNLKEIIGIATKQTWAYSSDILFLLKELKRLKSDKYKIHKCKNIIIESEESFDNGKEYFCKLKILKGSFRKKIKKSRFYDQVEEICLYKNEFQDFLEDSNVYNVLINGKPKYVVFETRFETFFKKL